ncbi:hypothetical protein AJ80_05032 [Polytolypa hystricis UAMH7299]|uniref:Uncharacterized protein n=1 Tax=Polytolypa hystricis (strain UAMH7299) TaxID=1447883 RepID=A0A2B7Y7I5_POLH7|nr:hypothetical protein AJ80_05032 [Polytolypa hystricis UAMH7299]
MATYQWGNPSPNTPGGLKVRFGWVQEYITKGKMLVEVLRFMDALRQAWSEDGTVLRITTHHPYTSKADCAIRSFLNPDLCPRWSFGRKLYKNNLLKNNDALDLVSDQTSRNNWIETFDEHPELDSAEKDAEPEDTESEDDKTIETVKELISVSCLSGNASTWAWLHLRFPQQLRKGGNTVLVDAITQLDPDFVRKKEWLVRLKMRKQLGIKEFVNDEEFQFHGRLIPPGVFRARTSKFSRPLLFKPGEATSPYPLCGSPNHPLMKLKDNEECFIFFDKDGINFRARDGKLLHHLPASEVVDFHNVAKQMNDLFSIDRSPVSICTFAIKDLRWKARKLPPYEWGNNSDQSFWIVWEAKKGTLWKGMVTPFNKEVQLQHNKQRVQKTV